MNDAPEITREAVGITVDAACIIVDTAEIVTDRLRFTRDRWPIVDHLRRMPRDTRTYSLEYRKVAWGND